VAIDVVAELVRELVRELPAEQVMRPGDPGYDQVRVWNASVTHRPAVAVRPVDAAGVARAVRAAVGHGVPLSVLGGGHDWAGRAIRPGGLVIDMSALRGVSVDPAARLATVGGGATAADVLDVTGPHGLVAATGLVGGVGFTGLTLGGGYGPIGSAVGLAADNLLGADVVLADGRLVAAETEPDLFWALRGGGGNFGVVTATRIRPHPYATVLSGFFLFPFPQAAVVLRGLADLVAGAPDELTFPSGILPIPGVGPSVFVAPVWVGDPAAGEPHLRAAAALGTPFVAQSGSRPYRELLRQFDASVPADRGHALTTRTVAALTPDVVAALVTAGETSPSATVIIHHVHGAAVRIPLESTAFGIRRDHLVIEIIGNWALDDPHPRAQAAWAHQVSAAIAPHALPGGYPNLLGPDQQDQIDAAYGPNAARLLAAKQKYDPTGVFTAIGLPRR
jgi:FAD/FMN-containing dehydrogenase